MSATARPPAAPRSIASPRRLVERIGAVAWSVTLALAIAVGSIVAVFAASDCDLPLWLRCLGGCPTYASVVETHLGAPMTRCRDEAGRPQRIVLIDVYDRQWFDTDGRLIALQVDLPANGAFCGGTRATRWFGAERGCH